MASPSFKQQKSKALSTHFFKGALSVNNTVPIYDAQTTQLNLPEDATNIDKVLEEYEGLIPSASVVLVAYTVSNYFDKLNNIHISNNISWIAVLHEAVRNPFVLFNFFHDDLYYQMMDALADGLPDAEGV
ncbi:hypothetical protein Hypma_000166 [Hypsizygus marmoreus]|uniref:Uncharacterized protein n=1 Tax=Hypsizygus marmoreus TaxID=39966 RepID=A0A369KGX5_HYPMA|nr:hypothetical protein Hypma_000166 [Hypsizygus marmoreus]